VSAYFISVMIEHLLGVSQRPLRPNGTQFLELNLQPFSVTAQPFGVTVDGGSNEILYAVVTLLRLEALLGRCSRRTCCVTSE
jgi:hypothetical protein